MIPGDEAAPQDGAAGKSEAEFVLHAILPSARAGHPKLGR
jgi:hypothetical protein